MPLPAWAQALRSRQFVGIGSRCAHPRRVDPSFISRIVSVPLSTASRRVATRRDPSTAALCLNASIEAATISGRRLDYPDAASPAVPLHWSTL